MPRTIGGKMIVWENGIPVPTDAPIVLVKQNLSDLAITALSLPYDYEGHIDEETGETIGAEPRFTGLTNGEVAYIRQAEAAARGDGEAFNRLLDRVLGKPKQAIESVQVSVSLTQYLEQLADANPERVEKFIEANPHLLEQKTDSTNVTNDPYDAVRDL